MTTFPLPPSDKESGVRIKRMTLSEAGRNITLAEQEGWNPGLNDAATFFAANPEGMLSVHNHNQPVGFASVKVYDSSYAFFGLYIVEKEHRGQGFGMAITNHRLQMAGRRSIGLDGVMQNIKIYARIGFRSSYRNLRFCAGPDSLNKLNQSTAGRIRHGISIIPLKSVSPHLLNAFDYQFFPASRKTFLDIWCNQKDAVALAAQQQGELAGYIVVRPCVHGSKVGPLFALNRVVAETLMTAAFSQSKRPPFYIDIPEPNRNALNLAEQVHLVFGSETVRMHIGTPRSINLAGVYGVTSLEMG